MNINKIPIEQRKGRILKTGLEAKAAGWSQGETKPDPAFGNAFGEEDIYSIPELVYTPKTPPLFYVMSLSDAECASLEFAYINASQAVERAAELKAEHPLMRWAVIRTDASTTKQVDPKDPKETAFADVMDHVYGERCTPQGYPESFKVFNAGWEAAMKQQAK